MFTNKLELAIAPELRNYDIFPKVVPVGKTSVITIKPLGRHAAFSRGGYRLSICPLDEGAPSQYPDRPNDFEYDAAPDEDGCIRFTFEFFSEQQYFVRLISGKFKLQLSVYAVEEDLAGRYPFRGDLHLHSFRSDGRQAPEVVAADYRKTGYDFLAITDHHRYYPSLDAIEAYEDVPIELCLVPGEEVHLPSDDKQDQPRQHLNSVHIVNFGGDYSVNALVHDEDAGSSSDEDPRRAVIPNPPPVRSWEQYWREVDQYMFTIDIPASLQGSERWTYASCHWIFDQIKRGGGLGIFCHPYWIANVFHIPPAFVGAMMESHPFGAYEVLGGENNFEQNGFQSAGYYLDWAKGRRYPIVGSTDSHNSVGSRNSHLCCTYVFSPENGRAALIDSILNFYSVAVDTIDEMPRFVGEWRFVRYACFLEKNWFPLHDELCFEEGRAMKAYANGEPGARETLELLSGRMKAQREKYFGW
ncbi:MAG: hypothetical protein FWE98_00970 [Oscillospiraceae bacterium]|nr:hypothetical protein [Oscillospiraceae bacterium]